MNVYSGPTCHEGVPRLWGPEAAEGGGERAWVSGEHCGELKGPETQGWMPTVEEHGVGLGAACAPPLAAP